MSFFISCGPVHLFYDKPSFAEIRIGSNQCLNPVDRTFVAVFAQLTSYRDVGSSFFIYCSKKLIASKLYTVCKRSMTKIFQSLKFQCTLYHAFDNRHLTNPKESTAYITFS